MDKPTRYSTSALAMIAAVTAVWSVCGCSQTTIEPEAETDVLRRLAITEWDLAAYSGKRIRVSSVHDAERRIEFPATADVRLVTQVILSGSAVAVFVLDERGTASILLNVGDLAGGLSPTKDVSSGVLYEHNGTPIIIEDGLL
ncbi:MAG: hypothetical protein WD069_01010 [Planctomycetales bacterium]